MDNSPELNGKYLGSITQDFVKIASLLREASYQMRVRKISQYPIFPIAKQKIGIGDLLINSTKSGLVWDYYVAFLEIFQQKELIKEADYFIENYKDPEEYCCLMVIDTDNKFSNFVYIPYPEDELSPF